MNEKAEFTRSVNEHFEFIFNAVSASTAILRQVLKGQREWIEVMPPAVDLAYPFKQRVIIEIIIDRIDVGGIDDQQRC